MLVKCLVCCNRTLPTMITFISLYSMVLSFASGQFPFSKGLHTKYFVGFIHFTQNIILYIKFAPKKTKNSAEKAEF